MFLFLEHTHISRSLSPYRQTKKHTHTHTRTNQKTYIKLYRHVCIEGSEERQGLTQSPLKFGSMNCRTLFFPVFSTLGYFIMWEIRGANIKTEYFNHPIATFYFIFHPVVFTLTAWEKLAIVKSPVCNIISTLFENANEKSISD